MNRIITLLLAVHVNVSLSCVPLRDCAKYVQVLVARVCALPLGAMTLESYIIVYFADKLILPSCETIDRVPDSSDGLYTLKGGWPFS